MTFGERLTFNAACMVTQACCLMMTVELAGGGRPAWAMLAGFFGLATAHAESYVNNWE